MKRVFEFVALAREAIQQVIHPEMSSQEVREECQRRRTNDSHNATREDQEIVRKTNKLDRTKNDSFMDNVNEVLEMIDNEGVVPRKIFLEFW